jgi:methylated-DNA-[protein]-cysteine S-methyltransferase
MHQVLFESPIGRLQLSIEDGHITKLKWTELSVEKAMPTDSELVKLATTQLHAYFLNVETDWSVPLARLGTEYQQRVWHYLQTIPVGETRTYSDVADALNSSARAVGNACRANPFVIIIPCHRVVSKTGLGGYDGQVDGNNIRIKQWLLEHERR